MIASIDNNYPLIHRVEIESQTLSYLNHY